MGIGKKHDYPPLLAPGRHKFSLTEIEEIFVRPFQMPAKRIHLFQRLEEIIQALLISDITCEVWVDGSFLTEKPDPNDLDVTVILEPDIGEALSSEQTELIETLAEGRFADDVDSFVFVKLRRVDPNFGSEALDPAYSWGEQYGLECSERYLKGFVVLRLRETNVGLRICS